LPAHTPYRDATVTSAWGLLGRIVRAASWRPSAAEAARSATCTAGLAASAQRTATACVNPPRHPGAVDVDVSGTGGAGCRTSRRMVVKSVMFRRASDVEG
jgi:hypothetical protein